MNGEIPEILTDEETAAITKHDDIPEQLCTDLELPQLCLKGRDYEAINTCKNVE